MSCVPTLSAAFPLENECSKSPSKEIIEKLCTLAENSISASSHERNLYLLEKYISILDNAGLYLDEIRCVMKAVPILLKFMTEVPSYAPLLLKIIKLMSLPLLVHETTDHIVYKKDYENYFNFFGFLLSNHLDNDVPLIALTSAIFSISRCYIIKNNQQVSATATREAIEQSYLPGIAANLLETSSNPMFQYYLQFAILLINKSSVICKKMAELGVINFCILKMYSELEMDDDITIPSSKKDINIMFVPYMEQLTTFLWCLLMGLRQLPKDERASIKSPGIVQMWCIRYFLRKSLLAGNNQLIRNNLIGLVLLIISIFDDTHIIESGLGEDIAVLSMATEMRVKSSWLNNVRFEATNEDLKFKQMAILSTCYCLKDAAYIQVISHYKVITSYLIIANSRFECINIPWSRHQQKQLLLTVLRAFSIIVPVSQEEFIQQNGFTQILMLLETFTIEPYDMDILYATCKTLNTIVRPKDKNFIMYLRSGITGDILISLCYYLLQNFTLNILVQRILSFLMNVLETLLTYYPDIQSYPNNKSVDLSLTVLQRFLKPAVTDAPINNKMFLCLGGFIWEAIGWDLVNLKYFINAGGVYLIMDVIEKGIFPVQIVFLGILVDLLDEGSCVSQLITWRGGEKKSTLLIPMLLTIYRYEEQRLEVQRQKNGAIYDEDFPIMGDEQWYETFYIKKNTNASPAVVDLLVSTRPKIYAILHLLRNRYGETIDISNEHFQTFNVHLSYKDQITMEVVGNFFALKLTEVWEEIRRDLQMDGIIPLAIDYDNIRSLSIRHRKWAIHLIETQMSIQEQAKHNQRKKFNNLWTVLRNSKLQTALEGLKEMDFVLRTSDTRFRHHHKLKQVMETTSSLQFDESVELENQHTTLHRDLKVEPVFNLHVQVTDKPSQAKKEADPVQLNKKEKLKFTASSF